MGAAGNGKSAFMGKLADDIYNSEKRRVGHKRPVIIRFCGKSTASSTGIGLMNSISAQILVAYGLPVGSITSRMSDGVYEGTMDNYADLLRCFYDLMEKYPVVLLLDGLDQLHDDNYSRSQLNFLRNPKLHSDSRIIVSTRPDKHDPQSNRWISFFGCERDPAV